MTWLDTAVDFGFSVILWPSDYGKGKPLVVRAVLFVLIFPWAGMCFVLMLPLSMLWVMTVLWRELWIDK